MEKSKNKILTELLNYLNQSSPLIKNFKDLPLNKSLLELGYLDSFGVIDLVSYIEKKYKINIENEELTKEKFGSINKMVKLISQKINV